MVGNATESCASEGIIWKTLNIIVPMMPLLWSLKQKRSVEMRMSENLSPVACAITSGILSQHTYQLCALVVAVGTETRIARILNRIRPEKSSVESKRVQGLHACEHRKSIKNSGIYPRAIEEWLVPLHIVETTFKKPSGNKMAGW